MKRRKKGKDYTFLESIDEFRRRFLVTMSLSTDDWNFIFERVELDTDDVLELKTQEIVELLLENEDFVRMNLENTLIESYKEDEPFKNRMLTFYSSYFGDLKNNTNEKFLLSFTHRFFRGSWTKTNNIYLLERRMEEEYAEDHSEEVTHVELCGILIPLDVILVILDFLPHNRTLISTLGCVNEDFFRLVLSSWKSMIISTQCFIIPNIVMKSVRNVAFATYDIYNDMNADIRDDDDDVSEFTQTLDLDYCFEKFNTSKIRSIDFSLLKGSSERVKIRDNKLRLDFPNLNRLKFHHKSSWGDEDDDIRIIERLEFTNLPRLSCLECDISDLHHLVPLFGGLRSVVFTLTGYLKNKNLLKEFQRRKFSFPNLEDMKFVFNMYYSWGEKDESISAIFNDLSQIFDSNEIYFPNILSISFSGYLGLTCRVNSLDLRKSKNLRTLNVNLEDCSFDNFFFPPNLRYIEWSEPCCGFLIFEGVRLFFRSAIPKLHNVEEIRINLKYNFGRNNLSDECLDFFEFITKNIMNASQVKNFYFSMKELRGMGKKKQKYRGEGSIHDCFRITSKKGKNNDDNDLVSIFFDASRFVKTDDDTIQIYMGGIRLSKGMTIGMYKLIQQRILQGIKNGLKNRDVIIYSKRGIMTLLKKEEFKKNVDYVEKKGSDKFKYLYFFHKKM